MTDGNYSHEILKGVQLGGEVLLRDYFAAKAMQGLCAGFSSHDENWPRSDEPEGYEVVADHAYLMADAMLKERDK